MIKDETQLYCELPNKTKIPALGFGTDYIPEGEDIIKSVMWALEAGYRHIDNADAYKNEEGVGIAIKKCIQNGILTREELFVTNKVPDWKQGYDSTIKCCLASLKRSGLKYFDLYLVHSPARLNENWRKDVLDTYRALETLYEQGFLKAIGVANFSVKHLEFIYNEAKIKHMLNQIELHPEHQQKEVVRWCKEHNIALAAWGSLNQGRIFKNKFYLDLAKQYNLTPSQIAIKWGLEKGYIVLSASKSQKHIKENFQSLNLNLDKEAISILDKLDGGEFSNKQTDDIKPIRMIPENSKEFNPLTYQRFYKFFGLTVLKEEKWRWNKTKWYLFGFIPVVKIVKKEWDSENARINK